MPLDSILLQIATPLGITPTDVYVLAFFLVFLAVFAFLGLERIYAVFFGLTLGIGIFVLLSTLLAPQYQTPETQELISDGFAKIIIGSSVYLIFILSILVPMNGNLALSYPKNPLVRIGQTIVLGLFLFLFFAATITGLMERGYIFVGTNSAFTLIKNTSLFADLSATKFYPFMVGHYATIILLGVGFIIYRLLFADIVHAMAISVFTAIKNRKWSGAHGGNHEWHDDHGHDAHDDHEMFDDHGHDTHDDHGHGHH